MTSLYTNSQELLTYCSSSVLLVSHRHQGYQSNSESNRAQDQYERVGRRPRFEQWCRDVLLGPADHAVEIARGGSWHDDGLVVWAVGDRHRQKSREESQPDRASDEESLHGRDVIAAL